jgi:hypothetical protein
VVRPRNSGTTFLPCTNYLMGLRTICRPAVSSAPASGRNADKVGDTQRVPDVAGTTTFSCRSGSQQPLLYSSSFECCMICRSDALYGAANDVYSFRIHISLVASLIRRLPNLPNYPPPNDPPIIFHPMILHPMILHPMILPPSYPPPKYPPPVLSLSANYASQHHQPQLTTTTI